MRRSTLAASLPTKVLREIFTQYLSLPTKKTTTKPVVRWSRLTFTTPVTLSHVCHKWRQVACTYPLFWSTLFVFGPSRKQLPLINQWLERSGTSPLNIQFTFAYFGGTLEENFDSIEMLMQALVNHHNRWRNIRFDLSNFPFPYPDGTPCPIPDISKLPRLQLDTAFLDVPLGWTKLHHFKEVWDQFFSHRSLRSLTTGFQFTDSLILNSTLRELVFSRADSWSDILDILTHCPNLETLKICLNDPTVYSTVSLKHTARPVVHKTLEKLILHTFGNPDGAMPILYNLTTPNLIDLDVPTEEGSIELVNELCNMVLRSNCRLLFLGELCVDKCPEKYISFLHSPCLQSLQQLSLNFATSSVLECLTLPSKPNQRPILPNLKSLEIDQVVRPLGYSLSNMLVSRFDTLTAANIVAYADISKEPLADKLWSHTGYRILRQRTNGAGIEILTKHERSDNPWVVGAPIFDLETFKSRPLAPFSPNSY